MSIPTISEILFEKLCSDRHIECERIPEGAKRTADYEVSLGPLKLIVEVKQLDPNEKDRKRQGTWGQIVSPGVSPGVIAPSDRVQGLITDAYPQIKFSANSKKPTMIVVYNNSGNWNWIDSFTVSKAMFGSFGMRLGLRSNQKIVVTGQGYMGNRKVTKLTLRALSVVGVMKQTGENKIHLDAYHNPFATNPIHPKSLFPLAVAQFIHPNPHEKGFVLWQPQAIET